MESNTNLKEFKKFIESDKSIKSTHKPLNVNSDKDNLSLDDLVVKTKEIINLKHYSIKTEKSYINWLKQFYDFVKINI